MNIKFNKYYIKKKKKKKKQFLNINIFISHVGMTDGKSKTDIYESSRCPNEKYLLEMLKKKKILIIQY
jgi:hypothetical protein